MKASVKASVKAPVEANLIQYESFGGSKFYTLKFCRACGFRVRIWKSYRTSKSFGYGYESVTELPEVPGIVAQTYITPRSSGRVRKVLNPYPGYCGTGCIELTEVPGTGMNVLQN